MTNQDGTALLKLLSGLSRNASPRSRNASRTAKGLVELAGLLTVAETATVLRTSRKAIYAMVERGALPGVTRIGRRVLIRADELASWLDQKRVPSLEE